MPDFMPICFIVCLALAKGLHALRWRLGRPW